LIDELRLLVIHGVLHLLGHDHHSAAEQKRMWAAQAKALQKVGASINGPTI
jgi:probable rRNA maturation factor